MIEPTRAIRRLAAYSDRYYQVDFLPSMTTVAKLSGVSQTIENNADLRNLWASNAQFALASTFWFAYARQGAPKCYWRLAAQALTESVREVGLRSGELPQRAWVHFVELCQSPSKRALPEDRMRNPVGPASNMPVIKGLTQLHLDHTNDATTITNYLSDQIQADAKAAHLSISRGGKGAPKVKGMGPKVTAFLLREVAFVYSLEGKGRLASMQNQVYLQPIDVWIKETVACLWPEFDREQDWTVVAERIVRGCQEVGVSPIKFNQGAWYYGAHEVRDSSRLCELLRAL